MADVIIIGKGPAGISASLYTMRAGINSTIIGRSFGSIGKAEKIENYYGFENPILGQDLANIGIAQATRIGAVIQTEEVVDIRYDIKFQVETTVKTYEADSVIIATGAARNVPKIPGIDQFEGKGVSYCAVCDGFFYKNMDVAVLGFGDFAVHEAESLIPIVNSVTMLTNGNPQVETLPEGTTVNTKKINEFYGTDKLEGVRFTDGTTLPLQGLFIAYGVADTTALAKKLGIATEGNKIVVDDKMTTNIPGVFAAGDCTGGMYQVGKAVWEGALAGTSAIKFIRDKNVRKFAE